MRCSFCGHSDSRVVDSRPMDEDTAIRRRRECLRCGRRFTTYEKVETTPVLIVKKDMRREIFNSEKIKKGLLHACQKRPVSMKDIDTIVEKIEYLVYSSGDGEFSSRLIGEAVMEQLKRLDEVAYVRFASVYRQFTDVGSFMDELNRLLRDNQKTLAEPEEKSHSTLHSEAVSPCTFSGEMKAEENTPAAVAQEISEEPIEEITEKKTEEPLPLTPEFSMPKAPAMEWPLEQEAEAAEVAETTEEMATEAVSAIEMPSELPTENVGEVPEEIPSASEEIAIAEDSADILEEAVAETSEDIPEEMTEEEAEEITEDIPEDMPEEASEESPEAIAVEAIEETPEETVEEPVAEPIPPTPAYMPSAAYAMPAPMEQDMAAEPAPDMPEALPEESLEESAPQPKAFSLNVFDAATLRSIAEEPEPDVLDTLLDEAPVDILEATIPSAAEAAPLDELLEGSAAEPISDKPLIGFHAPQGMPPAGALEELLMPASIAEPFANTPDTAALAPEAPAAIPLTPNLEPPSSSEAEEEAPAKRQSWLSSMMKIPGRLGRD